MHYMQCNYVSNPTCIISDGLYYTSSKSIATVMNEFFAKIGQSLADKLPTSFATSTLPGLKANCSQFKLNPTYKSFIAKRLRSMKTIGLDRISARLLKVTCPAIVPSLGCLTGQLLKVRLDSLKCTGRKRSISQENHPKGRQHYR